MNTNNKIKLNIIFIETKIIYKYDYDNENIIENIKKKLADEINVYYKFIILIQKNNILKNNMKINELDKNIIIYALINISKISTCNNILLRIFGQIKHDIPINITSTLLDLKYLINLIYDYKYDDIILTNIQGEKFDDNDLLLNNDYIFLFLKTSNIKYIIAYEDDIRINSVINTSYCLSEKLSIYANLNKHFIETYSLYYNGKKLDTEKSIIYYNIPEYSIIYYKKNE